jgi:hypothetical protein
MKINVTRTDVWATAIDDRPGGLAEKLEALSEAGANLEFIIARRTPEKPGKGVVFVTPVKGAKALKAAKAAGFKKAPSMHSLRLEGTDQPGIAAKMSRALAEAGVNLRGVSGAVIGRNYVAHLALDTAQEATKAASIIKKLA